MHNKTIHTQYTFKDRQSVKSKWNPLQPNTALAFQSFERYTFFSHFVVGFPLDKLSLTFTDLWRWISFYCCEEYVIRYDLSYKLQSIIIIIIPLHYALSMENFVVANVHIPLKSCRFTDAFCQSHRLMPHNKWLYMALNVRQKLRSSLFTKEQ